MGRSGLRHLGKTGLQRIKRVGLIGLDLELVSATPFRESTCGMRAAAAREKNEKATAPLLTGIYN